MQRWIIGLGVVAAVARGDAQSRVLIRADAEAPVSFTRIAAVRALRDGRVLVTDPRDRRLVIVTFGATTVQPVSRTGAGPLEYALPASFIALPGDTTWVADPANWRWLVLGPNGEPVGTHATRDVSPELSRGEVLGADDLGRIYVKVEDRRGRQPIDGSSGVAYVLRIRRDTRSVDTVVTLRLPVGRLIGGRPMPNGMVRNLNTRPLAPEDAAAVTPDGRVVVLRAPEYRAEWWTDSRTVQRGPLISYERVRVTAQEKRAFIEGLVVPGRVLLIFPDGRPTVPAPTGSNPAPSADAEIARVPWPDVKPPFGAEIRVAPDGLVWVPRILASEDETPPTYDLIDDRGRRVQTIKLPMRTRLVGFGRGAVYLVRVDDDDLEYLQRYAWP